MHIVFTCNATKAKPLQLELHYARIGDYEGVWAMEASAIERRASAANLISGAAMGGKDLCGG